MALACSCVAGNSEFRKVNQSQPHLYATLKTRSEPRLLCAPAIAFCTLQSHSGESHMLLRGDSYGQVSLWNVTDAAGPNPDACVDLEPSGTFSLSRAWDTMKSAPCGIIDELVSEPELNQPD